MRFEQLRKDVVYRVLNGNDTLQVGELVWIDYLTKTPHLNSVQAAAWLDGEDLQASVTGLEFVQQPNWIVETKYDGISGYSRAVRESPDQIVLVSLYKKYLEKILAGEKTIEVRKTWPKAISTPFTVLLYETGNGSGSKRIRARAICHGFEQIHDVDLAECGQTL